MRATVAKSAAEWVFKKGGPESIRERGNVRKSCCQSQSLSANSITFDLFVDGPNHHSDSSKFDSNSESDSNKE
jgi:hypothetical protein